MHRERFIWFDGRVALNENSNLLARIGREKDQGRGRNRGEVRWFGRRAVHGLVIDPGVERGGASLGNRESIRSRARMALIVCHVVDRELWRDLHRDRGSSESPA